MANPDFVAELVAALCGMYRREVSPTMIAMYAKAWADIEDDELTDLIQAHQETNESFPLPATIRQLRATLQMQRDGIPDVMEAWGSVRHPHGNPHPLAARAFKQLGGWDAFGKSDTKDEPSWRAQFRVAYEAEIVKERRRRTMSTDSQQAVGLLPEGDGTKQIATDIRQLVDRMTLQ